MSDRRKQIEEAAKTESDEAYYEDDGGLGWKERHCYKYGFIHGAEWADANNAEIPALKLLLSEVVPWISDNWRYFPGEYQARASEWLDDAKTVLASPKTPPPGETTPGDEDRGT